MKSIRGPEKNSGVERIKCFVGCLVELNWYADLEPDTTFTLSVPLESKLGKVENTTYTDSNPNPGIPHGELLHPLYTHRLSLWQSALHFNPVLRLRPTS